MLDGVIQMSIRTYSELITIPTFEERFRYLKLSGKVGEATFGFDRYLNQIFYNSERWKRSKREVIIRDTGLNGFCCDLGADGYYIDGIIIVHHMNPITKEDILYETDYLLDPEYLISTAFTTHNAIHYGDENLLYKPPIERQQYDTCPWKRY